MSQVILTPAQHDLLSDERRVLGDLRVALSRFGANETSQALLAASIAQLDEFFLLVVVGEFNAGKSAFINTLLGVDALAEGVTPTTARITVLRHGEGGERTTRPDGVLEVSAPVDFLRDVHIVDTPGTNAVMREHEALTAGFVPRSDLVLFITSADRPFSESERALLEEIRDWGKKIVVVINKIDILESEAAVDEVTRFVAGNAQRLLGLEPDLFPVSVRLARQGRAGDPSKWEASRFEALERYVQTTLDQTERVRLKLLNPLGVASRVSDELLGDARARLELLADDLQDLDDVGRQLAVYASDMRRDFELRMADVENLLFGMERRGHDFFDDMLRIGKVFQLLDRTHVRQQFEQQVVADTPKQIDQKVRELVDWLVDADYRQWQHVTAHLAERRRAHGDRIVGSPGSDRFHQDRSHLIDSVSREAQRVVDTFDHAREARDIAEHARAAVAASAAIEVGAAGLGTVVALAATTAAGDVTGLAMAGVLATVGFFVLPERRRRAKREMREKITALRERLSTSLRTEFAREITRSVDRIHEGIAPYSRFVRAERDRLGQMDEEIGRVRASLDALHERVECA